MYSKTVFECAVECTEELELCTAAKHERSVPPAAADSCFSNGIH